MIDKQHQHNRLRSIIAAAAIPLTGLLAVLAARWLMEILPEGFPLCPMLRTTGLQCPLCGGTHAVLELLAGHPLSALRYNTVVVAAVLPCGWMYIRLLISCLSRPYRPYRPKFSRWTVAIIIVLVALFTIVRNAPIYEAYFI